MRKELLDLRRAMSQAGVDVYVIPTDDFHGSEYVGEYFKCREFVSGFTGSAGTLVVTADWAGLWTDGRYFLQAADQLAGTGIDLVKMGQDPEIRQWLGDHLQPGQVLGFDGRTMTAATGKTYETAALRAGASLKTDLDLVGQIWADRPALSQAPAWALDLQYTGRSRKEKLDALRQDLKKAGADCHILSSLDDLSWLLNIRGGDVACCPVVLGFLILANDAFTLYAEEGKFSPELREELEADGISLKPYLSVFQDVQALPRDGKVLVDPSKLSYAIRQALPEQVLEQPNPTELPKAIKTPAEQANEVQAHVKDGVALTRFMKWLKDHVGRETITEISAAQKLEGFRAQQEHYLGPSFDPIFGYGPHGAIVHYSATPESDAPVEAKGFLLSDTGGHYLEGSTDVTRTFVCGPLTPEMRRHYTLVLQGHLRLGNAVFKHGCTGLSLDYLARQPLWDQGLDYNHGTGHGVGYLLSVHEGPQGIRYQTAHSEGTRLEPGMITSDEPGLYLENQYGIRLENLILCEKRQETPFGTFLGFQFLTLCPFELDAIDTEMLSAQERQWLNTYHAKVYTTLSPYMTPDETAWLKTATRPI
jgi:Xaa-Pro aminopeptidase